MKLKRLSHSDSKLLRMHCCLSDEPYVRGQQRVYSKALDARGRTLATSVNSYTKTHPLQAEYAAKANRPLKTYLHSEIAAIIKAKADIHTLRVLRIGADGRMLPAVPCPVCMLAIQEAGIQIVEHS